MSDNTGQGLLLGERIDAIESSLKLDRAIWQEYERRLDALEAMLAQQTHRRISKLEVETQRLGLTVDIKDDGRLLALEAGMRERPTWDALRDVIPYMLDLVTLGYRSSAQTERIKSAVDDRIRDQESAARGIAASRSVATPLCRWCNGPVAKAPDEPLFGDGDPPFPWICVKCGTKGTGTQAKEQPCQQDQSPSVASATTAPVHPTAAVHAKQEGSARAKDARSAAAIGAPSMTEPAPSSAAELRCAVAEWHPVQTGWNVTRAIGDRMAAAASRAVEEIQSLRNGFQALHERLASVAIEGESIDMTVRRIAKKAEDIERLQQREWDLEARAEQAEAERDEAIQLVRDAWMLHNTDKWRKQLDAFLARHPDAAQGGVG